MTTMLMCASCRGVPVPGKLVLSSLKVWTVHVPDSLATGIVTASRSDSSSGERGSGGVVRDTHSRPTHYRNDNVDVCPLLGSACPIPRPIPRVGYSNQ